jgi:hypothetical protein
MWTVSVSGLNGRDVTAEASLSKFVLTNTSGDKWAKATVISATYGPYISTGSGVTQSSNYWGIDGSPIRYLPNCSYMRFALEVAGSSTYAAMTGRLYIH